MSLLRTLGGSVILADLAVFLTPELDNLLLAGVDAKTRQVHGVGTHIGNQSVFIEMLCNHHRLTHREAQFAGCFLLQGGCGEGRGRHTLQRLLLDVSDTELCRLALFQELLHLFVGFETGIQLRLYLALRTVGIG